MGLSLILVKTDIKVTDGKKVCPIHLKYSNNGEYKRFPTKIYIEPKYWKEGKISNRCPDYTNINRTITSIRKRIEDVISEITEDNWSIMKLSGHKTVSSFQKYVSVTSKDIMKGQDLYSKEFDTKEEKLIREFIRKYPLEKIIEYYQKYK